MQYQHTIQKPTNTPVLIGSVVVGILALALAQYGKQIPGVLDAWMAKSAIEAAESKEQRKIIARENRPEESIERVMEMASLAESRIDDIYRSWKSGESNPPKSHLLRYRKQILFAYRDVMTRVNVEGDVRRAISIMRLKVEYELAQIDPRAYGPEFSKYALFVTSEEGQSRLGVMASVMRFAYEHHPKNQSTEELLRAFHQFVRQYRQKGAGIKLYSMYAEELQRNGNRNAAIAVLRQGTRIYKGERGVSRLTSQLVGITQ